MLLQVGYSWRQNICEFQEAKAPGTIYDGGDKILQSI
jgi:hypothetical protein